VQLWTKSLPIRFVADECGALGRGQIAGKAVNLQQERRHKMFMYSSFPRCRVSARL
jgi:hypothetical protein